VPDITQTLQDADLGFLKFVASSWEIFDLPDDKEAILAALQIKASDVEAVQNLAAALPPEAQAALRALIQKRGRVSSTIFERTYGEIRTMGVGRREREHPELNPSQWLRFSGTGDGLAVLFWAEADGRKT
jgi:hypothetical protein